ncbi:3'-5' exonuclease [Actinokineospora diospyrosa]|uniref:Exodeoxyribonuclease X n=1 Tax=Actinokineospora diospyrosa TaxID=103728 RepID=A0ABT1I9E6_9PSEU|nr:3'-5' exonuclease [Actinokineospora diospyrosa]MCP2269258.1 exodeoxyribonuclease X [Actinokineospora diospyrosa]
MTHPIPRVLAGQRLTVVDVEGNGGQPPEIVEIGVLALDQPLHPSRVATWLVRPRMPISSVVTRKVHGISNADVADSPTWQEVADEITGVLADRVIVAHNAAVEQRVLAAHLPGWTPPLVLDTLRLARHVWPGLDGYGLDRLIVHTGIDPEELSGQRHRAGFDAWMTARLLATLAEHCDDWSVLVRVAALPGFDAAEGGLW